MDSEKQKELNNIIDGLKDSFLRHASTPIDDPKLQAKYDSLVNLVGAAAGVLDTIVNGERP